MWHRSNLGLQPTHLLLPLESAWSKKLSECLRCLHVVRSPCHFGHGALPSSMLPLAGFIVVNRKFLERLLAGLGHHWQSMILAGVVATHIAAVTHSYTEAGIGYLLMTQKVIISILGQMEFQAIFLELAS
jgi:hypothetical protein